MSIVQTIKLCCGKAGCPELSVNEETERVEIKDDDGNIVTMEISQALLMGKALDSILKPRDPDRSEPITIVDRDQK
jgi:hypothetical protein